MDRLWTSLAWTSESGRQRSNHLTYALNEARLGAQLAELEAALGHGFARPELLVRALTHRSLANERGANERGVDEKAANGLTGVQGAEEASPGDNERLEFLGDAVLGLVVAEAMAIGLGSHLRLSKGEERGGLRNKATVLSNSMEAVLGALFLDGGLGPVRAFTRKYVMGEAARQLAEELRSGAALGNYKSALQEYLQSARKGFPLYQLKGESGPDHRKQFLVEVRLKVGDGEQTQPLARGKGSTKKLAEQDAARRALERLTAESAKIEAALPAVNQEEAAAE